jgi:hypothetical protein
MYSRGLLPRAVKLGPYRRLEYVRERPDVAGATPVADNHRGRHVGLQEIAVRAQPQRLSPACGLTERSHTFSVMSMATISSAASFLSSCTTCSDGPFVNEGTRVLEGRRMYYDTNSTFTYFVSAKRRSEGKVILMFHRHSISTRLTNKTKNIIHVNTPAPRPYTARRPQPRAKDRRLTQRTHRPQPQCKGWEDTPCTAQHISPGARCNKGDR